MLKLNASFSKKVPGSQQYSSEGFMASVEVEIPDGLNEQQLKDKIHQTFNLVQNSVEAELQNRSNPTQETTAVSEANVSQGPAIQANQFVPVQRPVTERNGEAVSSKQLKYLTDLLRETRHDASVFLQSRGIKTIYELSRVQCSQLIDLIKEQHVKAA